MSPFMQAKRLREEVINKIKRCSSYEITQPNLSTDNISDKSQTFQRKKNNHKNGLNQKTMSQMRHLHHQNDVANASSFK